MADAKLVALLAEDDAVLRNVIRLLLQAEGFHPLIANDGEEALELSRAFDGEIHLLVADVRMPHMTGDQLAVLIRRERPAVRILMLSAELSDELAARRLDLTTLQKPFVPTGFANAVREVMAAPPPRRSPRP
jgi:DNA-binding response OmpR family regulator